MAFFLDKTKESATTTAESIRASLTDAQKTVAASTETVTAPEKVFDGSTQARHAVEDNVMSSGIEKVKSKLVGAVTNASDGASSSTTVASRDLLVSTDNQPLLASGERGVETTTCWKECWGLLELMAASNMRNGAPRR